MIEASAGDSPEDIERFLKREDFDLVLFSAKPHTLSDDQIITWNVSRVLEKPVRPSTLFDALLTLCGEAPTARRSQVEQPTPAALEKLTNIKGEPLRVLLVEDNPINREVARLILQRLGCTIAFAVDGYGAIERTNAEHFDVVLMDCQMPMMDGYEATRQIRQVEASKSNRRIPIIAMTADAMSGARERCLAAGMDAYMSKPINVQVLHSMLRERCSQFSTPLGIHA